MGHTHMAALEAIGGSVHGSSRQSAWGRQHGERRVGGWQEGWGLWKVLDLRGNCMVVGKESGAQERTQH